MKVSQPPQLHIEKDDSNFDSTGLLDHLNGLTIKMGAGGYKAPKTDWCFGKIFTSEHSAKILLARFPHLRPYTVALSLFTQYEIKGR